MITRNQTRSFRNFTVQFFRQYCADTGEAVSPLIA
jgi:hypothetical protein